MSLFDDILGGIGSPQAFGPQEGFAGVLLGAAANDGHMADEELASLFTTLGRMKLYQQVPETRFKQMLDRLVGILKRNGPEELIRQAVPAVPPELRETVFANATDIVLADGTVEQGEKDFLQNLMIALELDTKRVQTILKVMVIKNKG